MDPAREELINRTWREHRGGWPQGVSFLKIAPRVAARANRWALSEAVAAPSDLFFEYRREEGFQDGVPMTRIVCEGIVVEMFPRS